MPEPVWIALTGVQATGHHGVFDHERRDGQNFIVDLRFEVLTRVGDDHLEGTAHYGEVAQAVVAEITGEPVNLIETLAGRIADRVLAFSGVQTVEVCVHKPQAPIAVPFTDVSVTLIRSNS